MKKYSIFFSLLLALLFGACKKDENKVTFEGGTAPVLTASSNTINLAFANADNQAVKLSWTNPEYRFNTGVRLAGCQLRGRNRFGRSQFQQCQ